MIELMNLKKTLMSRKDELKILNSTKFSFIIQPSCNHPFSIITIHKITFFLEILAHESIKSHNPDIDTQVDRSLIL